MSLFSGAMGRRGKSLAGFTSSNVFGINVADKLAFDGDYDGQDFTIYEDSAPTPEVLKFDYNDVNVMTLNGNGDVTITGNLTLGNMTDLVITNSLGVSGITHLSELNVLGNTALTGNVGIGTNNPSHLLHVRASSSDEPIALFQSITDCSVGIEGGSSGSAEAYLEIANVNADASNSWGIGLDDNTALSFNWKANGTLNVGENALTLLTNGKVGIGTNSPVQLLHARKDQNSQTRLLVENLTAGTASLAEIIAETDSGGIFINAFSSVFSTTTGAVRSDGAMLATFNGSSGGLAIASRNSSGNMRFYTGGEDVGNERMIIESGGNVGIGTDNPVDLFTVKIDQNSSTNMRLENRTAGTASQVLLTLESNSAELKLECFSNSFTDTGNSVSDGALISTSSGTSGGLNISSEGGDIRFWRGGTADANERFIIFLSSFKFFCPQTTPQFTGLDIRKGATSTTNNLFLTFFRSSTSPSNGTLEGDLRLDGSGNLALQNTSDLRLKKNITELTTGYNTVKNLRSVNYDWIDEDKPDNVIGFIAQEVKEYLPKSVDDSQEYMSMNYNELLPVMWSAIRKLIEKVEVLESQ